MERVQLGERPDGSVEDKIFRVLAQKLFHAELLAAVLAKRSIRVNLALHQVELVIDWRERFFRFDQDQPVHSVRYVLSDHRGRAMIDVYPGTSALKLIDFSLPGSTCSTVAPPPGPVAAWKSTEWTIALSA